MSGVDVLAVLDAVQRRLDDSFGDHSFPEFERSRAAVAELIEALKKIGNASSSESGCYYANLANIRIARAALARVTGVESPPTRDMQAEYQGANDGR